ncbi:MAG: hypothetical protein NT072_12880, partial [Deltaproteobacteria bacterium]|nr:hypothetical protein [Deltaproteobacteria bacterium]
ILADYEGSDNYRSHVFAQGVGGPNGAGLLYDAKGNDSYFATGREPGSYGTPGTFDGFSQGFSIGFRDVAASGGIGILMDTGGNDRMRAGNFSQGGGYYFGIGILRNAGDGNDIYYGSRYAQGFCAHSAAGILIDDGGDDVYRGMEGALQAAAWDLGVAALIDKAGNDRYESAGLFFSRGAAAHNGISLFIDMTGDDRYDFPEEPRVPGNNYHGGSSLAIFVDAGGGTDLYNGGTAGNNHITCEEGFAITADLEGGMKEALETD